MEVGYIGLGKMGKNMVLHLLEQRVQVVVWNRTVDERMEEVVKTGALQAQSLEDLVGKLASPRIIWLMLTAGETTDKYVDKLSRLLSKGDLIVDGGNSFYQDSVHRSQRLSRRGIGFVDIGTSGGPAGAREGACLMIGGDEEDFARIERLCQLIAAPGAYAHLGPVGAGHFAKMVHNGVEYGMMESIAEGVAILSTAPFKFNLAKVMKIYNNRSVVESRLVGWVQQALEEDPQLKEYSEKIGHTGEGEWTINTAQEFGVEVPVIKAAFQVRVESNRLYKIKPRQKNVHDVKEATRIRNAAVSAMRGKFGGHSVRKT